MSKLLEIMTVPEVRHRFAHQLGMFGGIMGTALAVMITLMAVFA